MNGTVRNRVIEDYARLAQAANVKPGAVNYDKRGNELNSLGELAASIAHEVNNPLTGILVYTRLLYRKISSGQISKSLTLDYLLRIDKEITRTTGLIQDLKDFGRQNSPSFTRICLNETMETALSFVESSISEKQITVCRELSSDMPDIMADRDQISRVFINLILNACQSMKSGGVLTLNTLLKDGMVIAEVRDTGCGISKKNMRKLFTPFFSTRDEVKGVGLGLAVSYGIVKSHGGDITVESQPGKGSAFAVLLPLNQGWG